MRFRQTSGHHSHGGGKRTSAGDVFNSPLPLHRKFPDRFVLLSEEDGPVNVGPIRTAVSQPTPVVPDEEEISTFSVDKEHRGGGRYRVIRKDTGEPVHAGLISSSDADLLKAQHNAMLGEDAVEE